MLKTIKAQICNFGGKQIDIRHDMVVRWKSLEKGQWQYILRIN